MKKINPATRILLLASVKKAGLYLSENSTPVARVSIDAAFNIRTDYNPEKNSWNKCLWPALAGGYGIGDYIGRCNEFISCALHETPQYTDFADDSRACAQVLVEDPALSERLSIHFENHNRYSKINPYNERFQLALKHRHVAILLLQHPALRGIPGEITEDHLQQLITHHKLSIPDSKIEKNAENQFEAQQETKLKTSMEAASEIPSAIQLEASPLKRPPEDHLQTQQISEKNEEAHQKPAPEVIPIIAMPSISQVEPASRSLSSSNTEATKPQLAETGIEHPTDKAQPTSNPLPCSSVTATIVRNSEGRYQATPPTDTYSNIDFSVEVDFTPSCTIL